MKVIDKIIKHYEQEAIDFALGGSNEEAERAKGIASKYTDRQKKTRFCISPEPGFLVLLARQLVMTVLDV